MTPKAVTPEAAPGADVTEQNVPALKDALRVQARACRAALPAAFRAAAARRLADVFSAAFAASLPPCVVSGYWPLGDEMDPRPLLAALRAAGCGVALPVTGPRRTPLSFRLWNLERPLVAGRFGTLVPDAGQIEVAPTVVLLPLLAFDRGGGRLGYGGGYYDRTLARLREQGEVLAVGLAYAAQEVAAVPCGPFDRPLDHIVTEREAIAIGEG